ncbi:MAG TPA: flagellar filament capping protein FliD, partial [Chloroflexota bacterium]|nr:flagellar filament capping protein FliD [Chloroflexota bacterium]
SAAKVTASYDAATDTFSLVAKDTGPAAIAVTDTGGLLGALGITGATQQYGKPAQYKINGGPVQSSTSNTVTNAVSGVTLTLKAVGTTTVDVAQDVATTVNGVKDFIKAYNEALTLIKQQQAVDPAGGSASVFTGSSVIQTIEGRLRRVVNTADSSLTTDYLSLPDIGINTGAIGSSPGTTSQMTLDESKLTTALQTDSTAVVSLLTSATGPLSTLNTYLRDTTSYTGPLNTTQTTADRQLRDIGDRMRLMQQRLDLRQRALEKRFADLETAMAKLQQQSSQLSGQLGQLGALNGG